MVMIQHPLLGALPGIRHAFFTRQGGHSIGLYDSCNVGLGSNDARETVLANRKVCMERLDPDSPPVLASCYQIHSAEVVTVGPAGLDEPPKADGLVTASRGIALGALAADCAPILFADANAGVIGAAHSGWPGSLAGIAEATIGAMENLGAERSAIRAVIGPCIAQTSYQVGSEFYDRFVQAAAGNADFFVADRVEGKFRFDLPGFVMAGLRAAGLTEIAWEGSDTVSNPDRFFSYRRATLQGEADYGRGLSAIALV